MISESIVIGNMLVESNLVALSKLSAEHFHNPSYRKAYELMQSGIEDVTEIAKEVDEYDLQEALDNYQLSMHRKYEQEVISNANARILELEFSKALALVKGGAEPSEAVASITVKDTSVCTDYSAIGNAAIDVYNDMEARVKGLGTARFIKTGLNCIDNMIGGLERGSLVIVAARAGGGKTSLGMDMAIHISKEEQVCFNSIEMDKLSIGYRATSILSGLNLASLRIENHFPADVWTKAAGATMEMGELNLHINDDSSMTVPKIIAQARRHKQKHGLAVLLIDYLGLIKSNSDKPRHLEIAEMTRALKGAAKELDCAVVLLSQLNRDADGQKPTIANLSDSSAIENDADLILFPCRPHKGEGLVEEAVIIVAKNRSGPIGDLPVNFVAKNASFKDVMENE